MYCLRLEDEKKWEWYRSGSHFTRSGMGQDFFFYSGLGFGWDNISFCGSGMGQELKSSHVSPSTHYQIISINIYCMCSSASNIGHLLTLILYLNKNCLLTGRNLKAKSKKGIKVPWTHFSQMQCILGHMPNCNNNTFLVNL